MRHISRRKVKTFLWGLFFALPWLVGFIALTAFPIGQSLYNSFTDFSIFKPAKWVGLKNYVNLFTRDRLFYKAILNTLYMVVVAMPVTLLMGLATAMLLNTSIKGRSLFRTICYLPSIVPLVASSVVWLWILNPQYGLLNNMLNALGLPMPNWLGDARMAKPSLVIMGAWGAGNIMVVFLAALQDVPRSLYEAAEIDGAGPVKKFLHITVPSITPVILFQLIMGVINSFQYFGQAYVLGTAGGSEASAGGPENALLFYAVYLYDTAFSGFKMGKASAMAWVLFVIVLCVTAIILATSKRWVHYGEE